MSEIIVTGGRDYSDKDALFQVLDNLEPRPTLVVQGGARGADALAKLWAQTRNVPWKTHMADWELYGPSAGPRRNRVMLMAHPEAKVIAFPGGKGTANCVATARELGREVTVVA
jgi:predicted polyphosphate/ATP-dependent NAD kinase